MAENTSPSPGGAITPVQQMLASGTGAILTSLFVTPLDVVKIRLQAQKTPFSKELTPSEAVPWLTAMLLPPTPGKCFLYCNGLMDHLYVCQNGNGCTAWYKAPTRFTGTLDAFVKITRYEGVRSLWSGLPPTLVMAVPATVIYFTTYDQLRDYLHARTGSRGHHIPLLAGALARLGAVTVISPLELIRTKMQSRQLSYRELGVCIQSAVAQDGWLSLWRGWGPTVLRDVPFSALYWFNYELVKEWLCGQARVDEATFMISFASGAISGTVAAVLTLPFDVVKTQRQIELGDSETLTRSPLPAVAASKPSSTWLRMRRIRAESGTRGLFAGFLPRVIKVAPACAIMISTYEFGKTFFQKLNQERQLRGL
ncbi:probable mitochondrial glutathione transporter SLC25A39 isoform X1 [Gavia stellata]|uniref:probable mitochondrial glutathione transporter SLC25A39 isoform X1 n=1 Tax=Gavia stellata TaxID=37040 RepID=UPI002897BEF6|nr:probable mitochondrial glutathione transporter SLC25A39 isoform X1 [Gavia stellata]